MLVRQSAKGGANTRRCRSCHAVRAAIGRLQKNHGKLVESFHHGLNNDKDKATAFYTQWPHLRGSALQAKLEEQVEQWQKESGRGGPEDEVRQQAHAVGQHPGAHVPVP